MAPILLAERSMCTSIFQQPGQLPKRLTSSHRFQLKQLSSRCGSDTLRQTPRSASLQMRQMLFGLHVGGVHLVSDFGVKRPIGTDDLDTAIVWCHCNSNLKACPTRTASTPVQALLADTNFRGEGSTGLRSPSDVAGRRRFNRHAS